MNVGSVAVASLGGVLSLPEHLTLAEVGPDTRAYVRVGGRVVEVEVVYVRPGPSRRRVVVRRLDDGTLLRRPCSAAALHRTPGPW